MFQKKRFSYALIALWGILVLLGGVALERYVATPGDSGTPAGHWPKTSQLQLASDRLTLVMFLHPHCPCSQASLSELARLLARTGDRVKSMVVFTRPPGLEDFGQDESLWQRANAMETVMVIEDDGGEEAMKFGSKTSGHTFLFASSGQLLFTGGVTNARGHAGDNAGARAIAALARSGATVATDETPIFGCSLLGKAMSRYVAGWWEP